MVGSKQAGFSLVEILIALLILVSVMMISSQSFVLMGSTWEDFSTQFNRRYDEHRRFWVLETAMRRLRPYIVLNDKNSPAFYFEGNRNGFVAVMSRSLIDDQYAAVVRISIMQTGGDSYRLILEEALMKDAPLLVFNEGILWSPPMLLLDDLEVAKFSYFGVQARPGQTSQSGQNPIWASSYNSLVESDFPRKIALEYGDKSASVTRIFSLPQPTRYQKSVVIDGFLL